MAELKPCPFCGSKASITAIDARYYRSVKDFKHTKNSCGSSSFYVYCNGCGIKVKNNQDSSEVIAAWNKRSEG